METTTGQTRRVQNLLLDIRDSRGAPPRLRPVPARAIRAFKPRFDQPALRPADPSSNHHAPRLFDPYGPPRRQPPRLSCPSTLDESPPPVTRHSHAIRAGSVPAPSPRTRSPPGDIPAAAAAAAARRVETPGLETPARAIRGRVPPAVVGARERGSFSLLLSLDAPPPAPRAGPAEGRVSAWVCWYLRMVQSKT